MNYSSNPNENTPNKISKLIQSKSFHSTRTPLIIIHSFVRPNTSYNETKSNTEFEITNPFEETNKKYDLENDIINFEEDFIIVGSENVICDDYEEIERPKNRSVLKID